MQFRQCREKEKRTIDRERGGESLKRGEREEEEEDEDEEEE